MKPNGIAQWTGRALLLLGVVLLVVAGQNWLNWMKLQTAQDLRRTLDAAHPIPSDDLQGIANRISFNALRDAEMEKKRTDALYCTIPGAALLALGGLLTRSKPAPAAL